MPPILRPLALRPIAWLWGGLAFSAIGDQLFLVVIGWVAASTFGANAGLLPAVQAAVMLATALFIGRLADMLSHRRAMIAADLLRAVVLGGMVVAWLLAGTPPAWTLVASVLALAVGQAIFRPAHSAAIPDLSPHAMLPATNALVDTTERSARLLGPGLIGVLAASLPLVHFVTIDVITFAISAGAVSMSVAARPVLPVPRLRIWVGLARGFVAVRRHRLLGFVLSVTGVINGAWYVSFIVGVPLLLVQNGVAGGIGAFGLVMSAYGLTNLAATLVVGNRPPSRHPARMIFGGNLCLGIGTVLVGLAGLVLPPDHLLAGLVGAAMVSAIGGPIKDITTATLRQTVMERGDIAAGMRAFVVANAAGLLEGLLVSPLLFRTIGVAYTIMLCGAVVLGVAAAGLFRFRNG